MSLSPKELLNRLVMQTGPCMRLCSYCPEDFSTREVKECVEGMIREIYALRSDKDEMLTNLIKVRAAYKEATGHDYTD
jgi:hypothetical protein